MEISKDYIQTEIGKLPANWLIKSIDEICSTSKTRINPNRSKLSYKCIELEHLSQGTGQLLGYADSAKLKSQKSVFDIGDVLFGKLRPYLRKYLHPDFEGVCTTEIWVLKHATDINDKWLYYLVQSDRFIETANQSTGTKMPRAEWKTVKTLLVPVPPSLKEQIAIGTALSDTDALISCLRKLIAKKLNIKMGAIQQLLQPKDGWRSVVLKDCLELLTDFEANGSFETVAANVAIYDSENFAWYVRATDLENESQLTSVKFVDRKSYLFLNKTILKGGEVLITKRGEIGKVYFFQMRTENATLAPNMYLLKLNTKVEPFFVFLYFKFGKGNKLLIEKNASSTLGALYKDDVKSISIPLPPNIEEQRRVANIILDVDNEIASLETKLGKYKQIKQGLMQQLLTGKIRLVG
jgi:type I restriction enzyme S subunit